MIFKHAVWLSVLIGATPCLGLAQSLKEPSTPQTNNVSEAEETRSWAETENASDTGNAQRHRQQTEVSTEVSPDGCQVRTTRQEDGAELVETLSYDGRTVLHSVQTFPDGHRCERRPMPQAARVEFFEHNIPLLAQLFNVSYAELAEQRRSATSYQKLAESFKVPFADLPVDLVTFTDVRGRTTILKQVHDGKAWHIAEVAWPHGLVEHSFEATKANGQDVAARWAKIEWLNGYGVRIRRLGVNQVECWRADGSRTLQLLTQRVRMNDVGELQEVEVPQYTIHWSGEGRLVSLANDPWYAMSATSALSSGDWQGLDEFITVEDEYGGLYRTGAKSEHFRLETNLQTGELTFKNHLGLTTTLKVTGERELKWPTGRIVQDRRGRITYLYGENEEQYRRAYRYPALAEGRGFDPIEFLRGPHWKFVGKDDATGKQKWELQNGRDEEKNGKKTAILWDTVRMNARNTLIVVNGHEQTSYNEDGTKVTQQRFYFDEQGQKQPLVAKADAQPTLTTIAVSSGDKPPAYTLLTRRDKEGQVVEQRLSAADKTAYVRRTGKDEQYLWDKLDADGKRAPDKTFAGLISIDEDGVLVRRHFQTRPNEEQPDALSILFAEDGQTPVIDCTKYFYTNGMAEEIYAHGGEILRDGDGNVLRVRYPQGNEIQFWYGVRGDYQRIRPTDDNGKYRNQGDKDSTDSEAKKEITAIRIGNELWVVRVENGKIHGFDPERDRDGKYEYEVNWNVEVDRATGEVEISDLMTGTQTHLYLDGGSHTEFVSGERLTFDPQGRITRQVAISAREHNFVYAAGGELVRVDSSDDYAFVDEKYQAPADLPLLERTRRVQGLQVHWEAGQPVIRFQEDGMHQSFWLDSFVIEMRGDDGELISVRWPNGGRYVLHDHQAELKRLENPGQPVKELKLELHGPSDRERSIAYTNMEDERYVLDGNGQLVRKDETDRTLFVMTEAKHFYFFTYAGPTGAKLKLLQGWTQGMKDEDGNPREPDLFLQRDPNGRPFLLREGSKAWLDDFSLSNAGHIVIDFADGPLLREVICLDGDDLRARVEVTRNGTITHYAARKEWKVGGLPRSLNGEKTEERSLPGEGFTRIPLRYSETDGAVVEWKTDPMKGEDLSRSIGDVATDLNNNAGAFSGFTKTVKPLGSDHPELVISVKKRGSEWIDNSGRIYADCRFDEPSKQVILRDATGLVWRLIDTEQGEIEVRFDEGYKRISQVVRDGRGKVLLTRFGKYEDRATTFLRTEEGFLEGIVSGVSLFVGANEFGQYLSNFRVDQVFFAKVNVDHDGQHVWTGETGIRRKLNNRAIEIHFPDGRSVEYFDDGESLLFRYPPHADLQSIATARRGETVLQFRDGRKLRRDAFSRSLDSIRSDGSLEGRPAGAIEVNFLGDVLVTQGARTQFFRHGCEEAAFVQEDGRWRDVRSGEIHSSTSDVVHRIEELGGQFRAHPHEAHSAWQQALNIHQFIGVFEFQVRGVAPKTNTNGEKIWDFAAKFAPKFANDQRLTGREGLAPGNPIQQIIQRTNGYLTIVLLDNSRIVVEPGQGMVSDDGYVRYVAAKVKDVNDLVLLRASERLVAEEPLAGSALQLLQKHARDGNPLAQELLADAYQHGRGVEPSIAEAVSWRLKRAQDDDPRSLFDRGRYGLISLASDPNAGRGGSLNGRSRKQAEEFVVSSFRQAADGGFTQAKFALAYCLREGIGAEQPDVNGALAMYRIALKESGADLTAPQVQVILDPTKLTAEVWEQAKPWLQQHPDSPDLVYAIASLRAAGEVGIVFAKQSLGELGEPAKTTSTPDEPKTFNELLAAAKQGDAAAQMAVAENYFRKNNYVEAELWFQKAADQGNRLALSRLTAVRAAMKEASEKQGLANEKELADLPVAIDAPEGLVTAARKGEKIAMMELARQHLAAEKLKEAEAWLEACIRLGGPIGYPPAENLLKEVKKKQGVEPAEPAPKTVDAPEPKKEPKTVIPPGLLQLAEGGDSNAMYIIGQKYAEAKEWEEAKPWLEKSLKEGNPLAQELLDRVNQRLSNKKTSP